MALASVGDAAAATCNLNAGGTVVWTCAAGDQVTISGGTTVTVSSNQSAASLTIGDGTILFSNLVTLSVTGDTIATGGSLTGAGTLSVGGTFDKQGAGTFTVADATRLQLNGALSDITAGDICLINNTGNEPLIQIFGAFHIAPTASSTPFSCGNNIDRPAI
jgi:hypothetical protein